MAKRVILAVAGAGKTYYICHEIDPTKRNLILAFTHENIYNIQKELCDAHGCVPELTTVSTFDSFVYHQLVLPYEPSIAEHFGYPKFVSRGICTLDPPPQMITNREGKSVANPLYKKKDRLDHYVTMRKQYYCATLSELVLQVKKNRESLIKRVAARLNMFYDCVLIDEFQDINRLQYEIIKMLAAPQNNLFIVGDDDQSIYRFRGSKPEIMLGFEKDYPDAKRILLDTNYRCGRYIVEASLNLISHNRERFDKKIIAASKSKAPVTFADFENRRDENIFLIRDIDKKIKAGAVFSDFAVLFRTNTQPRQLIEQLMSYNIPFKTKDNIPNIYEHWIARDLFTYQRIAGGSRDRADFLQIMNRPKRYLSRDSLCDATVAFDEWIKLFDEKPWIAERIEKLEYDMKLISRMNPYASINYIRRGIGYDDFLAEYAEYRNINKEDLFDILDEIQSGAKGFATYEEWYEHIRKYTKQMKLMALSKESDPNAVTLATLHSSKGLEFENVYIIDANEGIMPYKKAVLEKDIEEERRLFYVGMTRAKTSLSVYSVKSVNDKSAQASRFVRESKEPRQNNSRDD